MNYLALLLPAVKVLDKLYQWTVKDPLRSRGERLAHTAFTASVLRGSRIKLRRYQWRAARALEREALGTIRDGYYETLIDVTPPALMRAIAMK
jgi:hypothetical protein